MTFDPALLDSLAKVFAEAVLRELETNFQANAVICGDKRDQRKYCSGRNLERFQQDNEFRVPDHNQELGLEHTAVIGAACPFQRTTQLCRPIINSNLIGKS